MPLKSLSFVLLFFSLSFASFSSDLDTLAKKMATALKLSPESALSVTIINVDKNYMLPLDPLLLKLKEKLAPYTKEVSFNAFRGEENATILSMVLSAGAGYKPLPMQEKKIDPLILTGYYDLFSRDSSRIGYHLKIIDVDSKVLFESDENVINAADCPASIQLAVFDKISNGTKFVEVEYIGKVIKQFDDLFYYTPNNNLLAHPAEYRFEKKNPYALQWQVEWIRDILTRRYGITINNESPNSVAIEQGGSVIFSRDNKQYPRAELVDGTGILPDTFPEEHNNYHFIQTAAVVESGEPAAEPKLETRLCSTREEKTMRDRIYETFNSYYPALFNNFNYNKLDSIYIDQGHPSILVGRKVVDDPATGKEQVNFSWYNKKDWLNSLKKKYEEDHWRFQVATSVMGIFNDNLDQNRYWAIVKQRWQSTDPSGHVVYQDNGFLIVNFDFSADQKLKDFKIYYRLWFYDYQYDDLEHGTKRHEKLVNDLKRYFVDANTIGGIDSSLRKGMMQFLVDKVKAANTGLVAR